MRVILGTSHHKGGGATFRLVGLVVELALCGHHFLIAFRQLRGLQHSVCQIEDLLLLSIRHVPRKERGKTVIGKDHNLSFLIQANFAKCSSCTSPSS